MPTDPRKIAELRKSEREKQTIEARQVAALEQIADALECKDRTGQLGPRAQRCAAVVRKTLKKARPEVRHSGAGNVAAGELPVEFVQRLPVID